MPPRAAQGPASDHRAPRSRDCSRRPSRLLGRHGAAITAPCCGRPLDACCRTAGPIRTMVAVASLRLVWVSWLTARPGRATAHAAVPWAVPTSSSWEPHDDGLSSDPKGRSRSKICCLGEGILRSRRNNRLKSQDLQNRCTTTVLTRRPPLPSPNRNPPSTSRLAAE